MEAATPILFGSPSSPSTPETPKDPTPSTPKEPTTPYEPPPPFSDPTPPKKPIDTPKTDTPKPTKEPEQPGQPPKEEPVQVDMKEWKDEEGGKKPGKIWRRDDDKGSYKLNLLEKIKKDKYNQEKVYDREGTSAFLQNGGLIGNVDRREKILCRLNQKTSCFTNYIADSIDMVYAFTPLYAVNQQAQQDLYQLHDDFVGYIHSIGIPHLTLEAIIPSKNQKYVRTRAGKEPYEIQITTEDTFYYRENFLNVMARKTYDVWEYMLWIDAHQVFQNTYWWEESIYKMEQNNIAHLFYHVKYMRWGNQTFLELDTVTYQYRIWNRLDYGTNYFAGNAWGIRKDMYKKLDYILDTCIAGGCDYSLCYSLLKSTDDWPGGFRNFPYYFEQLKPWIHEAHDVLQESYGNVRGILYHKDHTHLFDYFGIQNRFAHGGLNIQEDLYRDENYTLHLKNEQLKKYFPW